MSKNETWNLIFKGGGVTQARLMIAFVLEVETLQSKVDK